MVGQKVDEGNKETNIGSDGQRCAGGDEQKNKMMRKNCSIKS